MIVKRMLLVFVCVLLIGTRGFSQSIPITVLSEPEATFGQGLTNVASVRELSDGRVIVVDEFEGTVLLLDATLSAAEGIGRQGEGPGEYRGPSRVFELGGDSSAILDQANRRLLVITPEASPGEFIYPPGIEACGPSPTGRLGRVQAGGGGRFYAQAQPIAVSATGSLEAADSTAIVRWAVGSCQQDTLGFVPSPLGAGGMMVGGVVVGRGGTNLPFKASVQWAVARDGRLAIVFPEPFHVVFISLDGSRVEFPIRYDAIRVSEGHKAQWREVQARPRVVSVMLRGAQGSTRQVMSFPVQEPGRWPRDLPPFLAAAVSFASDGALWIQRTTAAGEPPTFDVIDEVPQVVGRVELPMDARLVGFGDETAYVVRRDNMDLEYLQRYRLPTGHRR